MPRTNVCSEVTISNIRLAVRQVVADFCASPEQTVESIVNDRFENSVEPIQRLIAARLERIYEQIQYSILSPSNEPPSSGSVLRFLSELNNESEKDIVQRFRENNTSLPEHIHEQWQKFKTPTLIPINPASAAVDVPRLENLASSHSSRSSTIGKCRKLAKNVQNSNSFASSKTTSTASSTSSDSSLSSGDALLLQVEEDEHNRRELFLSGRKSSTISSCSVTERPSSHVGCNGGANVDDEILVEITKAADDALPVVLEQEFVPSVPSVEAAINPASENEKSKIPISLCSSLRSDDDKMTVQFFPTKVCTTDAAVSTDPVFMNNHSVEKIEVGVNTERSNIADGSSSSNTTSDNSAGQLPKRLFDTVLQRPSLRIVSLRPDGSIVPTVNSASQHFPSVREWMPVASEGNGEKSVRASESEVCDMAGESNPNHSGDNEEEILDSVSASSSRPDPFEEDLNTLANISPLPHS